MYSDIVSKINNISNEEINSKKWTIIQKKGSNIIITNKPLNISQEETDEQYKKRYNYYHSKMIENWNKYRDNDIDILGTSSLYYNYKEEIEKIIQEELEIQSIIDNVDENDDDDDYSDEERNYHLVY